MCGAAYSGSASMGGMYRRGRQMPSLVASIPFALLIVGTVSLGFSCAARWVLIVFGTLCVHWVNVYTTQSSCSLNQNTVVMTLIILLPASWHHNWVFLLHLEMSQKLRTLILCKSLPEFLSRLVNSCLHQLLGVDEVSGSDGNCFLPFMMKEMVWYFVSDTHKVMNAHILFVFGLIHWNYFCGLPFVISSYTNISWLNSHSSSLLGIMGGVF